MLDSFAASRECERVTTSDLWDEESARHYDDTSAFMFDPAVLVPAVDLLAGLAGSGPVLEFAIGTGRVAIPLLDPVINTRRCNVTGRERDRSALDPQSRVARREAWPGSSAYLPQPRRRVAATRAVAGAPDTWRHL